mgnify:CR=1 FL=1
MRTKFGRFLYFMRSAAARRTRAIGGSLSPPPRVLLSARDQGLVGACFSSVSPLPHGAATSAGADEAAGLAEERGRSDSRERDKARRPPAPRPRRRRLRLWDSEDVVDLPPRRPRRLRLLDEEDAWDLRGIATTQPLPPAAPAKPLPTASEPALKDVLTCATDPAPTPWRQWLSTSTNAFVRAYQRTIKVSNHWV